MYGYMYCVGMCIFAQRIHVLTCIHSIGTHTLTTTVCTFIFTGFNVRCFRRSAAIRKYFIHKNLDVTVNGHVHSSSQSMTSCVTKMAIIGYVATSLC